MTDNNKSLTYAQAGVDIDAGNHFVHRIKTHIQKTSQKNVLSLPGGYAGLFRLDLKKYPHPVLVSSTDGVGTKLKLAFEMQQFDSVGIDLVAMCVNDLICCGAKPLFFLDYYATSKLDVEIATKVVGGMATALSDIDCSLIGGETAEMPGLYHPEEFDLAGFSVGVVNQENIIQKTKIRVGDSILGLASSGVHSNGFSLVRKILSENKIDLKKEKFDFSQPIGLELLTPTKIYVHPVLKLLEDSDLKGIAHITGGGLIENVPRVLPDTCAAKFNRNSIKIPPIFSLLQRLGGVPDEEMWRVFNMGIGLVLIVSKNEVDTVLKSLTSMRYEAHEIGTIVNKTSKKSVLLDGSLE